MKSSGNVLTKFDIGMGAFDGAECSELIGLFMLHRLIIDTKIFDKEDICLYRDDILGTMDCDGPTMERKKKAMVKVFKEEGLTCRESCFWMFCSI